MTPAQLETAAKRRYNAVNDPAFPSEMIYDAIYEAEMQMANEAYVIEDVFQTTSTSGTREYLYPSNAIAIRRVEYKGVKVSPAPLEWDPKTSVTSPTGTPVYYAIWENTLVFYPTPSTSSETIKVYAYCQPQEVTSSSQTLDVPERYHTQMINFILKVMAEYDTNPTMASYYDKQWQDSLERIKRTQAKAKRGDQYAVVRDVTSGSDHIVRDL